MKHKLLKVTPLLFCLLFVITFIHPATATVVWSDDFNDGNYDGWTVEEGTWDVVDGALWYDSFTAQVGEIWHNSSQVVGTWSFAILHEDIVLHGAEYHRLLVNFMMNEGSGYGIRISETGVYLQRIDNDNPVPLNFITREGLLSSWTKFDITRDDTGTINVYVNATSTITVPDITLLDTTYSQSEKFEILDENNYLPSQGYSIDNITVDDQIKITGEQTTATQTETETPTEPVNGEPFTLDPMLVAIGGGAVVVILIVIVIIKRK